ncbi:hypothetical protein N9K60_01185 [Candidatus Poseidoniales archaeon]|nr:hypothetical protein [Candidatus Poseidoniales archaeon]
MEEKRYVMVHDESQPTADEIAKRDMAYSPFFAEIYNWAYAAGFFILCWFVIAYFFPIPNPSETWEIIFSP